MKHLLSTVIVLSSFLMPTLVHAENAFTPGAIGLDRPLTTTPSYGSERDAGAMRAWKRSLVAVAASQSLDIVSSHGMLELNPLLAGSDGRFGSKAASIKLSTTAAVVAVEYLIVKKWPASARILSKVNWGSSVLTSAFAAHNFAIK